MVPSSTCSNFTSSIFYCNEVEWIHADPVTGSSVRTIQSGAEYTRKEYEPFGQEVSVIEPEEEFPAPEGNADNLVDANDPHWQCQMADAIGTDFNIRPVHCQTSAQLATANGGNLFYISVEWNEKKKNHVHPSTGSQMPTNATPTDKPQEEAGGRDANASSGAGGGSLVPESSTPNSGRTDGCEYGTDGSKNNCIVYASMIDMEETGGVDASVGQDKNEEEKKLLKEALLEVKKRLKGDCLKALGGKKKVKAALNKITYEIKKNTNEEASVNVKTGVVTSKKGGVFFKDYSQGKTKYPDGSILKGNPHPLGTVGENSWATGRVTLFDSDAMFRAYVLLHEIGHVTGAHVADGLPIKRKPTKRDLARKAKNQAKNNNNVLENCFTITINYGRGTSTNLIN